MLLLIYAIILIFATEKKNERLESVSSGIFSYDESANDQLLGKGALALTPARPFPYYVCTQ